jgi:hypothetical protein
MGKPVIALVPCVQKLLARRMNNLSMLMLASGNNIAAKLQMLTNFARFRALMEQHALKSVNKRAAWNRYLFRKKSYAATDV